jgi:hypothetical protein
MKHNPTKGGVSPDKLTTFLRKLRNTEISLDTTSITNSVTLVAGIMRRALRII